MKTEKKNVKETLRALAAADPQEAERRHSRARAESAAVAKVMKKASILADFITEEDREESIRVVREAKKAMHHVYDPVKKRLVAKPDHKTRLAAMAMERAYDEGLPVQRTVTAHVEIESTEQVLARLRGSPLAREAIQQFVGSGTKMQIGDEIMEVEAVLEKITPQQAGGADGDASVQKSG